MGFSAKQILALDGERTMIQQTVDRLALTTERKNIWVITNSVLAEKIGAQLPDVPVGHILCEPAARNTAPACGLAAFLMERDEPDTVIGIFPSDHVVKDAGRFAAALRAGIFFRHAAGNIGRNDWPMPSAMRKRLREGTKRRSTDRTMRSRNGRDRCASTTPRPKSSNAP